MAKVSTSATRPAAARETSRTRASSVRPESDAFQTPENREAFLLKHVEDLEYEEIARVTGAGISALKMRVKRAREQLQRFLKEAERV